MANIDLRSLSVEELTEQLSSRGFPAFRAKQIRQWLDKGVSDFEQMTNIPKDLRLVLSELYTVPTVTVSKKNTFHSSIPPSSICSAWTTARRWSLCL